MKTVETFARPNGAMSAEDENEFLKRLQTIAAQSDKPAYGIADRRDANQGSPSWYTAVALPDGRIGAWAHGNDVEAQAQALEFARRYAQ